MKFKILSAPESAECGNYPSMKNISWGSEVEGEYCNHKQDSIFVKGEELVRVGGCPQNFTTGRKYMLGYFEEV